VTAFRGDIEKGKSISRETQPKFSVTEWWDVLLRTIKEVGDDRVTLVSAGVTYFLLLALFPSVTAFVSVYGLFADATTVSKSLATLSAVVPAGGLQIIDEQLTRITSQGAPTLGLALLVSLIIALWSSSSGVKAMFEAMNIAYGEHEKRNFLVLNATALVFTVLGVVGAALMLGVVVALPVALSFVGLGKGTELVVQILGYIILAVALLLGIAGLYRFGPSPHGAKWRWITPGAVLALVLIGVVSGLFSWYAANLGHFDKTYGSLGALIGFLFWMWVSIVAVIVGAELNSELERQAKDDAATAHKSLAKYAGGDPRWDRSADLVQSFEKARQGLRPIGVPIALAIALPVAVAGVALAWWSSRYRSWE
jgi:membrane protein